MAETAATATTQKGISAEDNAVLRKMFIMSHSVFMNFNMTKMEANCFTNTMAPAIEQVYVDDPEGKREAYLRHQPSSTRMPLHSISSLAFPTHLRRLRRG